MRNSIKIAHDLHFFFTDEKDIHGGHKTKGITLRILLIDDKLNENDCKAKIIRSLLDIDVDGILHSEVCWRTALENKGSISIFQSYCRNGCDFCKIFSLEKDVNLSTEKEDPYKALKCHLKHSLENDKTKNNIQIVAVQSLYEAQDLLSDSGLRFDLIMMDYLLAEKTDSCRQREYATEFWGDGIEKYFELTKAGIAESFQQGKYGEDEKEKYLKLEDIYSKIKANRGPMQRLWIFPITAFNQTFIDDLRNRGVRLIDYYWYLSRGADPINTPYLFIYTLNKFLQLMLDQAIFSLDEIVEFINKSIKKYDILSSVKDEIKKGPRLNQLFSTEYTYFINKYSVEDQIARDMDGGSLFARYVHENFIQKNSTLLDISKAIRRLYHSLAFGEERDYLKSLERLHRMLDLMRKEAEKAPFNKTNNLEGSTRKEAKTALNYELIADWEVKFNEILRNRFKLT
jgi:hypothetical protein